MGLLSALGRMRRKIRSADWPRQAVRKRQRQVFFVPLIHHRSACACTKFAMLCQSLQLLQVLLHNVVS